MRLGLNFSRVVLAVVLTACATNPVTGRRELALISEAQEIQMGQEAAQQAAATFGVVDDAALQRYVSDIGMAMARDSERPELPWSFQVVDDPSPNAFALPGGFIFVTRGLLTMMSDEAELATVIGHEIGHVTARHSVQQMSRAQLAQIGLVAGSILSPQIAELSGLASQGLQLLFLRYGRDAEYQADDLGFRYALNDNYDVRAFQSTFTSLARASALAGSSPLPTWLSTHPYPEDRIARNQDRVAALDRSLSGTIRDPEEYMTRINGLVYGNNPRNGFFEGNVFHHPDLAFRITFPQGWKGQNMTQAVIAVSPQEDAIIQLTLAGNASPSAALQQFLSQQGIQPGQASTQTLHGNPAAVGTFQAQTQEGGVLQGLVAMVQYGGNTYQLLGYTSAQQYQAYGSSFQQSLGTFQRETNQSVLAAKPNRVSTVKLPSAMSLSQFNQRYPSSISIEELALINQVQSAGAVMPAGTIAKRVVER
ncbi:MAG TPA: M48 family metalloprotease [Gemmatimonadales bacterium]|nr:M48 family metalloprotease [Gemmatimonadales bacterium]